MELYLDTANVEEIRTALDWGVISGVTTNPTLVAREKKPWKELLKEIAGMVPGPVSAEVLSLEAEGMVREARELAAMAPNLVIKIPMTPEGLKAVKTLSGEGIRTNVTLVFSATQGLLAARAGASFVSPFVGRLDDVSNEGMEVVADIVTIIENYGLPTRVIAASIRHPMHVLEAARAGAHIATVPFGVLQAMTRHPLTDAGIKRFLEDWEKARSSLETR